MLGDLALSQRALQNNDRFRGRSTDSVRREIQPAHMTWQRYADAQTSIARQAQQNREATIRQQQMQRPR